MSNEDPRGAGNRHWISRAVTFDKPGTGSPTSTERLTGTVVAQVFTGPTARGAIPDWKLRVRGQSGRELEISLVESRASFPE